MERLVPDFASRGTFCARPSIGAVGEGLYITFVASRQHESVVAGRCRSGSGDPIRLVCLAMAGKRPLTLAIDIGGTWIKAMLLDASGHPAGPPERVATPRPARPGAVLEALRETASLLPDYDRVSVGFPGVVERGIARTAANLHPGWVGVRLLTRLRPVFRAPLKVANDADIHGHALIRGRGVELELTLGTGVGSALFVDRVLIPNLELGH